MKVNKETIVEVRHQRKGVFKAIALEDFDTETTKFYPLAVLCDCVQGINKDWEKWDKIPCLNTLCEISIIENKGGLTNENT